MNKLGAMIGLAALTVTGALPSPAASLAASGWRQALPGFTFAFPRDHASHPAFKTEWWYYTGHLKTGAGRRYGYELTFFRIGANRESPPPDASRWHFADLCMAHFALSDEKTRRFDAHERLNRPVLGLAEARTDRYAVRNGTWLAELLPTQPGSAPERHHLRARGGTSAIDLVLTPRKPPVVHGHDGISRKSDCVGCASHYYSMTRLATEGVIGLGNDREPVTGVSWMDHEFGSGQLGPQQTGWDWFAVQLDDGSELMLYRLRRADGSVEPVSSGTYVPASGPPVHLPLSAFSVAATGTWQSPHTGGRYPMGWRVAVPGRQLDLTITPAFEDQELVTTESTGVAYWEGSCHVRGSRAGRAVAGDAYVELVGYAERFKAAI